MGGFGRDRQPRKDGAGDVASRAEAARQATRSRMRNPSGPRDINPQPPNAETPGERAKRIARLKK